MCNNTKTKSEEMGGMLCFKLGDRIKLRGIQLAETIGGGKSLATATGVATQSANQGIERTIRTEHWTWKDRCLPAHRSYCEAAAWIFCGFFIFFHWRKDSVCLRDVELNSGGEQSGLSVHGSLTKLYDTTKPLFSLLEEHLLSLWWLCEKLLRW